jgi:hypothetical protein
VVRQRDFYDRRFGVEVVPQAAQDRGYLPLVPETARRAIDEAVDHILYFPKVKIPVRPTESEETTAQLIAEKKRRFLTSWWRQVTQLYNPLGDGRKLLLNEGKIAVKVTLKWGMIPDKDYDDGDDKRSSKYRAALRKLGKYDFMWDVELLDNTSVFEDPTNHRDPNYVFLHYNIFVEEAKRMFPESQGEWVARDDYDTVEYLEYWSKPTFAADGSYEPGDYLQWIEMDVVHTAENPYPYIPVAIEDSGYGTVQKLSKVEDKYVGISQHSQDIFVAQARQWSAMEAVAELTAFNPIITRNLDEAKAANLTLGPGEIWELDGSKGEPGAEDIEFPQLPPIPITVPQMIQLTDQAANSTLKLDLLGGIPQTGVDTASEADQNVRNATAKLSGPVSALERLAAKISRWVLMDIEMVLEAPVTVYGVSSDDPAEVTIGPRDIGGYYDSYVEIRTTDEDAVAQNKARFWLEMALRAPFLSFFTALERGGVTDDPTAEMLKRSAEDVFLSEEFRMIRVMTGAQSFGELSQLIQNSGLNQNSTTGGSPQGAGLNGGNSVGTGAAGTGIQPAAEPPMEAIMQDALLSRNTNRGGEQFRG